MSTTPSGPPPSGPPKGPPSGPPKGPSAGGPPKGPPSGPPSGSGPTTDEGPNRNQLIAIVAIIALLLGAGGAVLVSGGGDEAQGTKERTIKLEPIAAVSDDPFTPPLSPDSAATPPNTIVPPPPGNTPFGGTGDNRLCDREQLISFLVDPANSAQGREWARVVGISVSDIPTYVRSLIPTVLQYDTRVTNHTFVNGRAVPLQSVLQAGTAVLVDEYGKLVARCRCGNPLLEPTKIGDPIYRGPKWPGFDPTTIIVVVVSKTPIYPPGGIEGPTVWQLFVDAQAQNVRGSQDSTTRVQWRGTFKVDGTSISGTGTGTVEFDGGCYDLSSGQKIADHRTAATFTVQISGSATGSAGYDDDPNRNFALSFSATNFQVTEAGVADCASSSTAQSFQDGTTEVFTPADLPGRFGSSGTAEKSFSQGEYQGTYTLAPGSGG
ncbi:MAG: DUF6777 domain-containing protein [Acidimicrobiia bacterium]